MNALRATISTERRYDDHPDLSWLDQTDDQMGEGFEESSRERKEAYERGDWHMVTVVVSAAVTDGVATADIGTSSCGGVESDSDESYFAEIESECREEITEDIHRLFPGIEIEES